MLRHSNFSACRQGAILGQELGIISATLVIMTALYIFIALPFLGLGSLFSAVMFDVASSILCVTGFGMLVALCFDKPINAFPPMMLGPIGVAFGLIGMLIGATIGFVVDAIVMGWDALMSVGSRDVNAQQGGVPVIPGSTVMINRSMPTPGAYGMSYYNAGDFNNKAVIVEQERQVPRVVMEPTMQYYSQAPGVSDPSRVVSPSQVPAERSQYSPYNG